MKQWRNQFHNISCKTRNKPSIIFLQVNNMSFIDGISSTTLNAKVGTSREHGNWKRNLTMLIKRQSESREYGYCLIILGDPHRCYFLSLILLRNQGPRVQTFMCTYHGIMLLHFDLSRDCS